MSFDIREIIETIQMTEVEHFDIRTVTLGISLRDCGSRTAASTGRKIYDKICRTAEHHVRAATEIESLYGVQIANKRVAVTPIAVPCDGFTRDEMVSVARSLDEAAEQVGIDYIAGFSALVEKGFTAGDRALIDAVPEALAVTRHVCSSVNCGSTKAGINADAVLQLGHTILETARRTAEHDSIGCAKFVAFCNAVQDNPFVAGAFHGISEPEVALNVGISGPGVVLQAIRELPSEADFGALADVIKRMAFKITRAGELIGRRCAERLRGEYGVPVQFGIVDLSLAPTPAEGDSIADILKAMGLEDVGGPGTTAALALLNDAVKKGGIMAAGNVGGLSGAFIPVSEDQGMITAVANGRISLEKLEAMSSICSVGLDMVAVPGDTPAEVVAGILFDEFAIGAVNEKTTAVRIIPVQGKTVGEYAEFGGLLGRAPVMPVSQLNNSVFTHRGGRIPPTVRALTN